MSRKKLGKEIPMTALEQRNMLGDHLNFGASEAYKLLRTNLEFSLPKSDRNGCPVIGITSSLRGEGKSTTSINLGYTIAQSGKRVLLLECDLRLPNIAKRLGLAIKPGLSNALVGHNSIDEVIQQTPLLPNYFIATAGDTPPNPSELLGSGQMGEILSHVAQEYDYILLDLPPLSAVSDALVVSNLIDGMVVVVRQNVCTQRDLAETMRQLTFAGTKLLGFVMTDKDIRKRGYGRYGKYGKYGKYGRYGDEYGYGNTSGGGLNNLREQQSGKRVAEAKQARKSASKGKKNDKAD